MFPGISDYKLCYNVFLDICIPHICECLRNEYISRSGVDALKFMCILNSSRCNF